MIIILKPSTRDLCWWQNYFCHFVLVAIRKLRYRRLCYVGDFFCRANEFLQCKKLVIKISKFQQHKLSQTPITNIDRAKVSSLPSKVTSRTKILVLGRGRLEREPGQGRGPSHWDVQGRGRRERRRLACLWHRFTLPILMSAFANQNLSFSWFFFLKI